MADIGRPTVMTEEVLRKLEDAYSNDATDLEACFLANISKSTLYDYQQDNPDFVERKKALKEMTKYRAKKNIKEKIQEGDVDTSKWYVERKGKDEGFSNRQELSGPDGKELQPQPIMYVQRDDSNNQDQKPKETD